MTLKTPHIVHIEKPDASLADLMNHIRSWLDSHSIQPIGLQVR